MGIFDRRSDPWRDLVTLQHGERALLGAESSHGWIVATTYALWMPEGDGMQRLGWEVVDSASWDRDSSTLTVRQNAPAGERPRRWAVRLEDDRDLLLVIKERVRATLVATRHVHVAGTAGATVVARRPPSGDDLAWAVSLDPGVDPTDPQVRGRIDAGVAAMRADLGQ